MTADDHIALHDRMRVFEHGMHAKLDAMRADVGLALRAIHHILTGPAAMDHADRLSLVKKLDADLDAAVTAVASFVEDRASAAESNDDVDALLAGFPDKLAKLSAAVAVSKAPVVTKDSVSSPTPVTPPLTPAEVHVTVSSLVTSPATVVPVDDASEVVKGATVEGPGIAIGTVVDDMTNGSLTLSLPTLSDLPVDASLLVKAPVA